MGQRDQESNWWALASPLIFMIYFCSVLMSFIAVHCALLSVVCLCLSHIVKLFGVAGLVFGVG